jgi:hypothetical protein
MKDKADTVTFSLPDVDELTDQMKKDILSGKVDLDEPVPDLEALNENGIRRISDELAQVQADLAQARANLEARSRGRALVIAVSVMSAVAVLLSVWALT